MASNAEQENASEKQTWLACQVEKMLIEKRRIFLSAAVDEKTAQDIIKKLWYLDMKDSKAPILFVINSPGGSVDAGFAIWDQIKMIKAPVYTLVTGLAASMGSILSLCAEKSKRFATKNSRIMIHQPLIAGVIQGQATDLEIQAKEIIKTREALVQIYQDKTGKEKKQIEKALDRDTWMSASEAKEFNLIDEIVDSYEGIGLK